MPGVSEDGRDGNVVMESTKCVYDDWKRQKDRKDYIHKVNKGFVTLSYHSSEDKYTSLSEEYIPDQESNFEDSCMDKFRLEAVREALERLNEDEKRMIEYLYLSDKPGTERGYSALTGISPMTVHDRKIRILKKLKKFLWF